MTGKCRCLSEANTYMSHVMRKPVLPYANNQGADQPARSSLISTFVVRCLDSIIPQVFISEISSINLASVAAHAGWNLPWSQTPKTGFLVTRLNYMLLPHLWCYYRQFSNNCTPSPTTKVWRLKCCRLDLFALSRYTPVDCRFNSASMVPMLYYGKY